MNDEMTLEKTKELFEFLKGNTMPPGFVSQRKLPKMSAKKAFNIIYILQEGFCLIPDHYEMCYRCECLYDSDNEGGLLNRESYIIPKYLLDHHVCDNCLDYLLGYRKIKEVFDE